MAFNSTNNAGSHTASHGNPIQNTAAALNPSTGTGSHLPPTDQSRNPLSSHNDHVDTAHSNNPIRHNETTGTGHSSITGNNSALGSNTHGSNTHSTNHHDKREDGGVVDALNPSKGHGTHLPSSGHNQTTTGHNQYDNNTHSSNPLSSNTHSSTHPTTTTGVSHGTTGTTHGSTGLTGSSHNSHATHGHKAEDGGVVDAINPAKGPGAHLPNSGNNTHSNTGAHTTGSHTTGTHGAPGLTGVSHGSNVTGTNAGAVNPIGGHHTTGATTGTHNPLDSTHHNTTTSATHPSSTTTTGSHNPIGGTSHTGAHNNTTGAHGAHSNAHSGTGINSSQTKVPVGDKIKGTVEALVGKVTSNPAKVAEGEALKTGSHTHGAAAGVQNAAHNSSTTGSHI